MREEVAHLSAAWADRRPARETALVDDVVAPDVRASLDRFDRVQLQDVLEVCRDAPTLSAAGRQLFDRSRERKQSANDADRLRKYLARFGLDWAALKRNLIARPD